MNDNLVIGQSLNIWAGKCWHVVKIHDVNGLRIIIQFLPTHAILVFYFFKNATAASEVYTTVLHTRSCVFVSNSFKLIDVGLIVV